MNQRPEQLTAAQMQELPDGYEELHAGQQCLIAIKSSVLKEIMKKATRDQQAGLQDLIERYGAGGWGAIPRKKFNASEGAFNSRSGRRIRLEAFKPRQLRAYGFAHQFRGRQTFFITGVDTSKKQNEADQTILQTSGKEAIRILDLL